MDENLSTTPVRGAPQASSPTDTASTATSTAVSATGITTPFSPEATASAPTPPLFNQTNVRKHEYWQFAQLIAPADALPEGKKAWTTDDAVGIWCLRCSKALSYQKGSSQSIRYHMETKHPAELVAFRDRLAKIKGESGSLSVTSSPASGTPNGRGTKRKESPGIEATAQQLVPEPVGQQASSSGASVSSSTSSLYEIAPTTLDMNASLIPVSTAPAPAASAPVSISTPASHASIIPSTAPTTTTATAITRAAGNTNDDLTSWHRNVQRRSGFWGNAYWYDLNLCRRMPLAKPMLDELIAALPPCDSKRVIDLCAGSGRASAALLAAYPTAMVTLVDSSSERLVIAQKRLMEAGAVGHVQFVTKAISPDKSGGSESITNSMPVEVVIGCLALHVLAEKPKHYQAAGVAGSGDGTLFSVETTYEHIFRLIFNSLTPGGHLVFADHVGQLGLFAQLQIMAKVGFVDVDCAWRQEDSASPKAGYPDTEGAPALLRMASSYQGGGILGKQQQQQHLRSRRGSDAAFLVNGGKPPLAATSSVFAGNRRNCIAGGFPGPKACPSVIFSSQMLGVTVGGCAAFYSAVLSCAPEQPVTISPVNLPACIRVSPSLLVFDRDTWMIPQFFRVAVLSAVYDDNNKGDRKLQVVEHVSSSSDSRFSGNKIMFLPPNVLVQVSGREGCYMFSSGASIGTALPQQLSTSSASSWQTFHEFMQVELEATGAPNSAFATRELLNARSSVMSHQSFSSVSAGAAGAATGVEVMHTLTQAAMASKRMSSRRNLLGSSPSSRSLASSVQGSADGYYHSTPRDGVAMVKVTSRAQHTVVLYKSGKWGLLGKMDVDYTSEKKDKDMTGVNGSRGSNSVLSKMLVDIECGDAHIAALTEQGYVMTWGEGSHGRLGHGTVFTLRGPQAIKSLFHKRIVRIACGAQHTVAVAEDGDVYSWGYGKTGALGHGLNVKEQTFESVHMPMEILTLKGKGVAKVSCGDAHTAVVLQNGTLLTCGWSEYGRLGRSWPNSSSSSEFASCFEKVNLKKKLCTFVACGAAHTLVLTECKSLYAFGWNVNGQLGLGDRRNRHTPTQIQYFDADELVLTSISAGKLHSMALTQDARVFAWGSDELGQCGIGSFPQIYTVPHLVASIVGVNATQVSAGERHSVVLTTASQKQLDSMQSDHPTRYATLMGNFELFVKSDYERQAKVLAYAKESQLRREYEGRKRKPPIDPSSSLVKMLQLQCRVQSDMTQLDAEMNNVIMVNIGQATVAGKAKSRACRPLTAGVVLSSSVYYGGSRGEKEDDERVVEQVSSPEASVAKQKRVRCSSATLWRQTRLLTFQPPRVEAPEAQTSRPKSRDLPISQRRLMSTNIVGSTATPKLSVEARKSLATMLNGDPEPQSAFTNMVVRSRADDASRSRTGNGNQQDASFPAMASSPSKSSTNQSAASHFASFPVSRPKSAPSQARSKR